MCLKDNLWATIQYLTCIFLAAFCIFVHTQDDRRYMVIYKDTKLIMK